MKNFSTFQLALCVSVFSVSAIIALNANAQEAPAQTAPAQAAEPPSTHFSVTNENVAAAETAKPWRDDARLKAKITLQAKRMPLSEVLKTLSEQSGIALDGGELSTTKKVTLSVRDMELRTAMDGLEDLYQANWQTQGDNTYVLQQRELLPWRRNLAQLGNFNSWGFYRKNWSRSFAPPYLTTPYAYDWQALLDSMDRKALESPEGVPFSSLPPDVQQEVRRATSWEIKHQAIEGTAVRDRAEGDWTLRLVPENYPSADMIEFFHAPIPNKLDPPIAQIVSGSAVLALLPFRKPGADTNNEIMPGNHMTTRR